MTTPYRADQVGSFLRPPELLEARQRPPPDPERLRELEDRHILRVLARQKELRLPDLHATASCAGATS